MAQRKVFDPATVPITFWRSPSIQQILARRDVGKLFRLYLDEFPECTQTQLALLTEHDRSDISNFVRGIRSGCVSNIDVLDRVAEGLLMPDEARTLLGLAPSSQTLSTLQDETLVPRQSPSKVGDPITGWLGPSTARPHCRIAICGSRSSDTEFKVFTEAVRALGGLLMRRSYQVIHGPVGVGIEVMTYIADRYRPPGLTRITGRFGHASVVRDAEFVVVIGGGEGTLDETDLAFSLDKRVIPLAASGGTAQIVYAKMQKDAGLRSWMSDEDFRFLGQADAVGFVLAVQKLTSTDSGETV